MPYIVSCLVDALLLCGEVMRSPTRVPYLCDSTIRVQNGSMIVCIRSPDAELIVLVGEKIGERVGESADKCRLHCVHVCMCVCVCVCV